MGLSPGDRFGRLVVKQEAEPATFKNGTKRIRYLCICDCGTEVIALKGLLRQGLTQSCGCFQSDRARKAKTKAAGFASFNKKYAQYRSGAEGRGMGFNLTLDELTLIIQKECVYCGSEAPSWNLYINSDGRAKMSSQVKNQETIDRAWIKANGIDRINNSIGYTPDNCVSCCRFCNSMKSNFTRAEFLKHATKIVAYNSTE